MKNKQIKKKLKIVVVFTRVSSESLNESLRTLFFFLGHSQSTLAFRGTAVPLYPLKTKVLLLKSCHMKRLQPISANKILPCLGIRGLKHHSRPLINSVSSKLAKLSINFKKIRNDLWPADFNSIFFFFHYFRHYALKYNLGPHNAIEKSPVDLMDILILINIKSVSHRKS